MRGEEQRAENHDERRGRNSPGATEPHPVGDQPDVITASAGTRTSDVREPVSQRPPRRQGSAGSAHRLDAGRRTPSMATGSISRYKALAALTSGNATLILRLRSPAISVVTNGGRRNAISTRRLALNTPTAAVLSSAALRNRIVTGGSRRTTLATSAASCAPTMAIAAPRMPK